MRFKPSLFPPSLDNWEAKGGASVSTAKIVLPPGGKVSTKYVADAGPEEAVAELYKLELDTEAFNMSESEDMLVYAEIVYNRKDKPSTVVTVNLNKRFDEKDLIRRFYSANGDLYTDFEVSIYNKTVQAFTISAIRLFPTYSLDDRTVEEVDRLVPAIAHIENDKGLIMGDGSNIVDHEIPVSSNTNLTGVMYLNFKNDGPSRDIVFKIFFDEAQVMYSPVTFTIQTGYNIINVPINLLQVGSGSHKLKISAESSHTLIIGAYKLQLTLNGKSLLNKQGSSSPEAFCQQYMPVPTFNSDITEDVHAMLLEVTQAVFKQEINVPKRPLGHLGNTCFVDTKEVQVSQECKSPIIFDQNQYVIETDKGLQVAYNIDKSLAFSPLELTVYGSVTHATLDSTNIKEYSKFAIIETLGGVSVVKVDIGHQGALSKHLTMVDGTYQLVNPVEFESNSTEAIMDIYTIADLDYDANSLTNIKEFK